MTFVPGKVEQYITVEGHEPVAFVGKVTITKRLNFPDELLIESIRSSVSNSHYTTDIETGDDELAREMFEMFTSGAKQATITLKITRSGWLDPLYAGWRQPRNLRDFWRLLKDIARYTWREATGNPLPAPFVQTFNFTNMMLTRPAPHFPPMPELDFRTNTVRSAWPEQVRFESRGI